MSIPARMRSLWVPPLALVFLLLAGNRNDVLRETRREQHLQAVPPEDTTPLVALTTVAFGGFRGLVADALWVRANRMQEEGQFFELVQLAKWITQLEPRVPEVWSFQAWNLAYNISVLFPEPEDRWRWVRHGIDLLRREGLTHNPASASLHWDLGWMYQHKVGMAFDDAHLVYKRKLAAQVESLLPDGTLPKNPSPELREALWKEFVMDAETMADMEESYGPIDWRLPSAHSLYWSTRGLPHAEPGFTSQSLRRMRFHSLQVLMQRGDVVRIENSDLYLPLPRLELIPVLREEYGALLDGRDDARFLRPAYESFLIEAIRLNLDYNRLEEARDLFDELAARNPEVPPGPESFQALSRQELNREPADMNREHALGRVVALVRRSLHTGDPVLARGMLQIARQTHRLYQNSRADESHLARTGLPPFDGIVDTLEALPDGAGNF